MNPMVIVYYAEGEWRWRMLGSGGRVMQSSQRGFAYRDDAVTSACVENPGIPVEVDTFFSGLATG
ncbi:MAG: hypothetical protein ACRDI3_01800 [Actinomycetota bacterium]